MKTLVILAALAAAFVLPATAGAVTVGTSTVYSSSSSNGRGVAQAYRFTAPSSGQVDRLNLYLDGASTASRVEVGLYSGSWSSADTLRARCVISSPRSNAWNRCSFTAYAVTSGAPYWLALLQPSDSSGRLHYREGLIAGGPVTYLATIGSLSSLPASWTNGASWSSGYQASIYADQAASTPPPPPPPADADDDGVPDSSDQCPGTPAGTRVGANGCPAASTQPPTANFSVSPNPAVRTQPTTFTSTGSCSDAPCTYRWLHGDATSTEQFGTGQSATFTYIGPIGTRTITLLQTDADGQTDTETKSFNLVEASAPPSPTPTPTPTPAPSPGTSCMANPSACGYPDVENTGLTVPETSLDQVSNNVTLAIPGQVYENKKVDGCITVEASGVIIRNVKVEHWCIFAIRTMGSGSVTVEDSEIDFGGNPYNFMFSGSNITIRRTFMHNGSDCGAMGSNFLVQDSFCSLGPDTNGDGWADNRTFCEPNEPDPPHWDGFQTFAGSNFRLIHNTIRNPCKQTSAISIGTNFGGVSDVQVLNNLIAGGGYPLYCNGSPSEDTPNEVVTGNRFSRALWPNGGYWGAAHYCKVVDTWTGNVWDENNAPVSG